MKNQTDQQRRARLAMCAKRVDSGELLNAMCQLGTIGETDYGEAEKYLKTRGLQQYTELVVAWLVNESQRTCTNRTERSKR